MNKPLKTILVGAGGYGGTYVNLLLNKNNENNENNNHSNDNNKISEYLNFCAIVDPYAQKANSYERFKDIIPVYENLEDFFAKNTADLTIISSPIFLHYSQCVTALENGSHVLCEKPLVPTIGQYNLLAEKIKSSGKTVSVGFQWCHSEIMLQLKQRILAEELGKPVCFKSYVSWPRDWQYYARGGGWAGKVKTPSGEPVHDSVASNATAHYIQNMLFLLGGTMEESASLTNTAVECYKANEIEAFDTIIFRGEAGGAEVYYAASHAVNYQVNPMMIYEFEKASIFVNVFEQDSKCTVHHRNGKVEYFEDYKTAIGNGDKNKLLNTAQSILGERDFTCTAQTVRPFTAFIDTVFSQVKFHNFPDEYVIKDAKEERTYVKHLHLDLLNCFRARKLPSELALPWAKTAFVLE